MGSSGTPQGQKIPPWAQQALEAIVGPGPLQAWTDQGGRGAYGAGPFGDIGAGFNAVPSDAWGQALSGLFGPAAGFSQQMGNQIPGIAQQGSFLSQMLGLGGLGGAGQSMNLSQMVPSAFNQSQPYLNSLSGLIGMAPGLMGEMSGLASSSGGRAFQGQAANAALGQMGNTGPNSDLYKRTAALLTPQVRASFGSRGMAGSGAAIREESNQAQQLADSFAQRAMQEKIGLLGQAVGGESANAQMTGAQNSLIASLMGNQAGLLGAGIQGALGGAQAPGQILSQLQGGLGGGMTNLAGAQGLQLGALQPWGAAQQMMSQLPAPLQAIFGASRGPFTQMLQAGSGASPLSKASQYWSPLGIPKG